MENNYLLIDKLKIIEDEDEASQIVLRIFNDLIIPLQYSIIERSLKSGKAICSIQDAEGKDLININYIHKKNGEKVERASEYLHTAILALLTVQSAQRRIIITNNGYGDQFIEFVKNQGNPLEFVIFDPQSLKDWWETSLKPIENKGIEIFHKAIFSICHSIAEAICKEPDILNKIEWRELEKLIASIFRKIGFNTILTQPSKDGGKDIIIEFEQDGNKQSYIIEIKHWTKGNKVGQKDIEHFVEVKANELHDGGIFISTGGYSQALARINYENIYLKDYSHVFELCEIYLKKNNGIWYKPHDYIKYLKTNSDSLLI